MQRPFGGANETAPSYFLSTATSARVNRALRRFAALRWMTPRLAALSIAEMRDRIWLLSDFSEERVRFCRVRRLVRTRRLRRDRLAVWRARLAADLVLAIFQKATGRGGSRSNARLSRCGSGTSRNPLPLPGSFTRPGHCRARLVKERFDALGSWWRHRHEALCVRPASDLARSARGHQEEADCKAQ
jgi:hypothetical protein